jgi:hypothetical protein
VNGARAEFTPLRPRRPRSAVAVERAQVELPGSVSAAALVERPSAVVEQTPVEPPPDSTALPCDEVDPVCTRAAEFDEERFAAAVREEAIRFAAIAVARALREHLRDAIALTVYVDDALRACGRAERHIVRLHPSDAAAYRAQQGVDVIADPGRARGEVSIAAGGGEISATIEDRAEILARAAAYA